MEQCPQIRRPLTWLTGLGPPVVFTARWGAALHGRRSDVRRYLLRTDEGYRAAPIASGSLDRVGVKGLATAPVLDLMHAVQWRARAYEERCETNSRQYTPLRNRSQASRSGERQSMMLPELARLPAAGNSVVFGNTNAPAPRSRMEDDCRPTPAATSPGEHRTLEAGE